MRGVVLVGDEMVEVRDFPAPRPGPNEVVVRIRASGICGTDLHLYHAPSAERAAESYGGRRLLERLAHLCDWRDLRFERQGDGS